MQPTELGKRKIKQKYLREQIIQQELNAEEFSQFIADRRDEGKLIRWQC